METCKQHVSGPAKKRCGKIRISGFALFLPTACLLAIFLSQKTENKPNKAPATAATLDNTLSLVLTPQTGDTRTDKEISRLQQQIRSGRNLELCLEQLGWAFVTKARESFDPGFYKLAEQCAR